MVNLRIIALAAGALALTAGCATTNPQTGEREVNRTAAGAVIGGVAGALAGTAAGGNDTKNAVIGGVLGAAAGAATGQVLDRQARALEEQAQGTGVAVTREEDAVRVTLPGDVTFATGSATITPALRQTLVSFAQTLQQEASTTITVIGHTDSTGSLEFNDTLSKRRAQSVADVLTIQGVAAGRINVLGVGPTQPVASNDTAEGRAQNRRVEFTLT